MTADDPPPSLPTWAGCIDHFADPDVKQALVDLVIRVVARARELREAGERVTVVLVSRRMSCLWEMFVTEGLEEPDVDIVVVSDRALDGGVPIVPGQRVILVDDVLILGSTLADRYDRIVEDVGDDPDLVEALVACVDRERSSRALVRHMRIPKNGEPGAPLRCSTKVLERTATDIASGLYRAGRPYFTDFPLLVALPVAAGVVERLLASDRWYVADVSPPAWFGGSDRRALSVVPRPETERTIRVRIIEDVSVLVEGIKVRIYIGPGEDGGHELRLVPMGLPGAMLTGRLAALVEAIEATLSSDDLQWRDWKKPEAWHRLVQMFASACVLTELWDDLEAAGVDRKLTSELLDPIHLKTYFGQDDAKLIKAAFDRTRDEYRARRTVPASPRSASPSSSLRLGMSQAQEHLVRDAALRAQILTEHTASITDELQVLGGAVPPPPPEPGVVQVVDPFWVHRVLSVFGSIDDRLERPQEHSLQKLTYPAYHALRTQQEEGQGEPRVIRCGLSMTILDHMLIGGVGEPGCVVTGPGQLCHRRGQRLGHHRPVDGVP